MGSIHLADANVAHIARACNCSVDFDRPRRLHEKTASVGETLQNAAANFLQVPQELIAARRLIERLLARSSCA